MQTAFWSKSLKTAAFFATLTLALANTDQAYGLIDGQVLVGKRWYDFEIDGQPKKGVSATSLDVAGHIDPIPLIPIAIGVGMSSISPSSEDLGGTAASFLQIGLDVQAWIPLVPFFTPYVKFRYPFMGELKVTEIDLGSGNSGEATYKLLGPAFDAGIKMSLLPFVKLLFQVGKSMDSIEISDYRINGVKQANPGSGKAPGSSALLGLEIGF